MQKDNDSIIVKQLSIEKYRLILGYTEDTQVTLEQPQEFEHWSDLQERVLGHICFDFADNYFYLVVLARDENKKFRAIDLLVGLKTLEDARKQLLSKIESLSKRPDEAFYNEDETC